MMATNEAVLMILPLLPPGFFLMASIAYLHPHQTPFKLMFMVKSQIFSSVLSALSSAGCMMPVER